MKRVLIKTVCLIGLFMLLSGCAAVAKKDNSDIRDRADDSFKELQREEDSR